MGLIKGDTRSLDNGSYAYQSSVLRALITSSHLNLTLAAAAALKGLLIM